MRQLTLLFTLAIGQCCAIATAGDWPQILGPTRNGLAADETIRRTWDAGGPRTVWEHAVGQGYAGVAVVGERVVLLHRVDDREVVDVLDAQSGDPIWSAGWPVRYLEGIDPDRGPRCVPLVHEDHIFVHGVTGRVVCLRLADGNQRWVRDTRRDFDFPDSYFGAGSSPLAIAGRLLVNVGGRDGSGIVAFSPETGQTLWKATDQQASYSSPVATTIDGRPRALFITRLRFVGIDPVDGQVRWQVPFGRPGPTVNGANPLLVDERHVLLTASYGVGAQLVDIQSDRAQVVWSAGDVMSSQYPTPVVYEGAVYGIDGREDVGTPHLRCIDPLTGKVHWSRDGFGMASLILADKTLLVMKSDGELVLVDPTDKSYRELARFKLFNATTRALPALSNGKLYVRDSRTLKCFDLSP